MNVHVLYRRVSQSAEPDSPIEEYDTLYSFHRQTNSMVTSILINKCAKARYLETTATLERSLSFDFDRSYGCVRLEKWKLARAINQRHRPGFSPRRERAVVVAETTTVAKELGHNDDDVGHKFVAG